MKRGTLTGVADRTQQAGEESCSHLSAIFGRSQCPLHQRIVSSSLPFVADVQEALPELPPQRLPMVNELRSEQFQAA